MYVCLCMGVTSSTVQQAIDAGARTTKQVATDCGAGSICGRCRHTVRDMIAASEAQQPRPPRRRWRRQED
jgi:bacterioferritin-associated ferredoxin